MRAHLTQVTSAALTLAASASSNLHQLCLLMYDDFCLQTAGHGIPHNHTPFFLVSF